MCIKLPRVSGGGLLHLSSGQEWMSDIVFLVC
nr:MAG TPA: hypothetical protein [Caudoviricetes sp.]